MTNTYLLHRLSLGVCEIILDERENVSSQSHHFWLLRCWMFGMSMMPYYYIAREVSCKVTLNQHDSHT